jgi:hypothetical protein
MSAAALPVTRHGAAELTDRGNAASATAFTLIFPVFIVYQVMVQSGIIAPVLGGYGTAGAVAALPLATYAFLKQTREHGFSPTPVGALFALYLALFAATVFLADPVFVNPEITAPHIAYIFKFVVWYLVARTVDGDSPAFRRLARVLVVAVMATVIGTAASRGSIAPILLPVELEGIPGDYQAAAMIFVAMAAYAIPPLRVGLRLPFYAIGVATLFLIGARSEFIAFFVLGVVTEFCKARSRTLVTLLFLGGAVTAFALLKGIEATADGNRILGLLEVASDESAIMRSEMLADAWITVGQHPVLGDYGSYPPGQYAHNFISAWVDFGIVPLAGLALRFGEDGRRDDFVRALAIACVVALLLAAAKVHTYQLLSISLGLYARYRAARQRRLALPR